MKNRARDWKPDGWYPGCGKPDTLSEPRRRQTLGMPRARDFMKRDVKFCMQIVSLGRGYKPPWAHGSDL